MGASAGALALGASSAWAQTPEEGVSQLGEVVVTAERREASLQDTPISITAVSGEAIEKQQILDVQSIAKVSPGMSAKPTLSPLEITVSIRGITGLIPSIAVDPPIGTYTDGVYNVLNAGSNASLIDLERVEVLKGPQGTLFGRNTIGGLISIVTAKPNDEFGGSVSVAAGNYDAQTYTGVLNAPIMPGAVAARVVYQHLEHDGYGQNFTTRDPAGDLKQDYLRASVKITPADGWEILGTSAYTRARGHVVGTRFAYVNPNFALAPGLPPLNVLIPLAAGRNETLASYIGRGGHQDTFSNLPQDYSLTQQVYSGTITGELSEHVTVKSITAHTKTTYNTQSDTDGTPYILLDLVAYPIHAKQFSQEFQVYGDAFDNKLKWIGGLYYYRQTADQGSKAQVLGNLLFPPVTIASNDYEIKNKSYSAFAQATYEIMPNLRLTGGVRYVKDKRFIVYHDHFELGSAVPGPFLFCQLANAATATSLAQCNLEKRATFEYVPWTVGLDYQPNDDTLLYAKISKGFRSGAFDVAGPHSASGGTPAQNAAADAANLAAFGPVDPERLVSYEAGGKFEFMDRRLRLNLAAYWSKYDDIQLAVNAPVNPNCPACIPPNILLNVGSAEIYGGEVELAALLGRLELASSVGYSHPKYTRGPRVGERVANVSKLNVNLNASYPIEMELGTLTLTGGWSYRSKAQLFPNVQGLPPAATDAVTQKGFGLFDARASFELESAPVTVSVFGQNLADKKYFTSAASFGLGYAVYWPGAPRTYGVELKYEF